MNLDLDELEKLAKAATPGQWVIDRGTIFGTTEVVGYLTPALSNAAYLDNYRFIAKFNPELALALISEIRKRDERIKKLRDALYQISLYDALDVKLGELCDASKALKADAESAKDSLSASSHAAKGKD